MRYSLKNPEWKVSNLGDVINYSEAVASIYWLEKSIFKECGNYDENFYFAQDYKLFLEIIKKGFKVKSLREPLYYLNMKDNMTTCNIVRAIV